MLIRKLRENHLLLIFKTIAPFFEYQKTVYSKKTAIFTD